MHPTSERSRTAQRSLVATLEITALAAAAHVIGGGDLPAPEFLLGFSALVFAGSVLTIGRFLRVALVVPFVFAAQLCLHLGIEAAHPTHAMAMPAPQTGFLGMTGVMFWAHLVTALGTAIVLLLQERLLATVAAWLQPITLVPFTVLKRAPATVRRLRWYGRPLIAVSPRRGPPRLLTATP